MYHYTVDGINFASLPNEKQELKMDEWQSVLLSVPDECEMSIMLSRKPIPLTIGGKNAVRQIEQISIGATESISGILEAENFDATFEDGMPELDLEKEALSYLRRSGGFSKVYVLYDMPANLSWGWIHDIFGACDQVRMWTNPIERDAALKMLTKKRAMLSSSSSDRRSAVELEHAIEIERLIVDGSTRLFNLSMVCVVNGENRKGLKKKCKIFERAMRVTGASFDDVTGKQGASYYGEWRKVLSCDLSMFNILYPFHSAEMMEMPSGVILGVNLETAGPVIYDIAKRVNGNVAIIGTTGSGKSFAAKLFVKRLIERVKGDDANDDADIAIYIIDPMNEYYQHRKYYGLEGIVITGDEELGLDPIRILKPSDAASMISIIAKADPITNNAIMANIDGVKDIKELYDAVPPNSKSALEHLVKGPTSNVLRGDSKFTDHMVISLKGYTEKPHETMILLLVLNKIWQRVIDLPQNMPKIIILDEGWALARLPASMKYIEQIVRMGRKLNVKFVFISQKVDDIAGAKGAEGKLIDNMGTKILMKLEDDAAQSAMKVLGLSEPETRALIKFNIGEGLLLTNKHRVKVKFEATAKETDLYFNTNADRIVSSGDGVQEEEEEGGRGGRETS